MSGEKEDAILKEKGKIGNQFHMNRVVDHDRSAYRSPDLDDSRATFNSAGFSHSKKKCYSVIFKTHGTTIDRPCENIM